MKEIKSQTDQRFNLPSLYLYGTRGSGKSVLLRLLAKRLKDDGYLVYFFSSGDLMEQEKAGSKVLNALTRDRKTKVAVVVDEVPSAGGQLVSLLHSTKKNLVVIGAGVPQFDSSGFSVYF
jgi:predicted AAA+ superfamily ATPase